MVHAGDKGSSLVTARRLIGVAGRDTGQRRVFGIVALIAFVALMPLLGGCRGDGDDDGPTSVPVELGDWYVRPDVESVQAGEVRFEAANEGAVVHELVVLQTGLHSDALPMAGSRADVEAAGEVIGRVTGVPPGETRSAAFQLAPGRYVLLCNIDGHYQAGMHADFEVTESE